MTIRNALDTGNMVNYIFKLGLILLPICMTLTGCVLFNSAGVLELGEGVLGRYNNV